MTNKLILIFSFCILSMGLLFAHAKTAQQEWDDAVDEVKTWVEDNSNGKPISRDIQDMVAALNLLGFYTDDQFNSRIGEEFLPRIFLDAFEEESKDLENQIDTVDLEKATPEEIDNLKNAHKALKSKKLELVRNLKQLLDNFYKERKVSSDQMIILEYFDECFSLVIQGQNFQHFRSKEERAVKSLLYKEEIKAFALYLKNSYFNSYEVSE